MTGRSDSESEYEESPVAEPLGTKQKTLMRNPTVITIHSDSEYEQEDNQGLVRIGTNMPSGPMDAKPAGANVRLLPLGISSQKASNSRQGAILRDGPTASNEKLYMGLAGMPNRDNYINQGVTDTMSVSMFGDDDEEDEDEDDNDNDNSDDDIEQDDPQVQPSSRNGRPINMFGNYLLAPMGFDEDESSSNITIIEGYTEAAERFQIFAGVNEFDGTWLFTECSLAIRNVLTSLSIFLILESDQLGLGEHPYRVVPKSRRRDQERILENKRRQGKLLLVSLLDNFCLLYEQSPERSRKLFYGKYQVGSV
jgi:hypothetical protein